MLLKFEILKHDTKQIKIAVMKNLRADLICGILATSWFRMFRLPVCSLESLLLKYIEL